ILHYYQGLISRARGQTTTAAEALRRAVYLQPDFLMAQYHLALARLEQGEADASRRSLAALARQAAQLSPTTRLCEGEGMTAADLRELARLQLESGG
ncbi:MAG TPA: protein-glutamate methyltransferase, partial [Phenylobacterium sp.]|nr:protein-glutamate methyltransferase [Phenylobacterium sp.]